jgi:pectinesterase
MIRFVRLVFLFAMICGAAYVLAADAPATVTVTVRNPIALARTSETVELQAADLQRLLGVTDVRRVHVREEGSSHDLLVQAVDTNGDGKFEELIFQIDIGPNETRRLYLTAGERQVLVPEDFKAYGRFVQEREDDFAWENDRIAHRAYGKALETWPQEPLVSSSIDVWTKRVRRLVVNNWYMVGDYHHDHGEGGDFYQAGASRGCGGTGLWANGKLYPSANFRQSRTLANGPIRVMFELTYDAWDAAGVRVSEVKRITLDAGQNLDRFESQYKVESGSGELIHASGIRKKPTSVSSFSRERGLLRTWETMHDYKEEMGQLGIAVIAADPASITGVAQDAANYLLTMNVPASGRVVYYAGFGWTRSGDFKTVEDWDRYVSEFEKRLRAPLEVTVGAK